MNDVLRNTPFQLSPKGAARRQRMLGELTTAMRSYHAARVRRRRIGAAAAILLLSAAVLVLAGRSGRPIAERIVERPAPSPAPVMEVTFVRSTPGIVDRYRAVPTGSISVEYLRDDTSLLAALHDAGVDAGLARIGDRVFVTH